MTEKEEQGTKDGDLPAFPTPDRGDGFQWPGMTIRDYFAAQALIGLANADMSVRETAKLAYVLADAMVEQRGGLSASLPAA